jgi:hypothetical protein
MNTFKIEGITYITTDEPIDGDCEGCAGEKDSVLCNSFLDELGCHSAEVIWIKKESTEEVTPAPAQASSSENITFSSSQIEYLSEVFGIDASEDVLKVSDGFVKKSGTVWRIIPKQYQAIDYWDNIKDNPEDYSINEPKFKV